MISKTDKEVQLLVETIYQIYGYDFRHYRMSTIKNRFIQYKEEAGFKHISEMIPEVIHNRSFFDSLFLELSVTVTEMFRDPYIYNVLRQKVIPQLKTYPYVNIWHAGCATGEEVYSMAIFLEEEGILHRSQIYGTDINDRSLAKARKGIYPLSEMQKHTINYQKMGGKDNLASYYHTRYKAAKMDQKFNNYMTFSKHNLATDWVFSETQLILCRNVLIYFNQELKNRVFKLFTESLCHHGYLCLGSHESIDFSAFQSQFEVIDEQARIYRKM